MSSLTAEVLWTRPIGGKFLLVQAISLFRLSAGIIVILMTARGV